MSDGGFSKARLGRWRDNLAAHAERGAVPGLAALIARRGEVHVAAFGVKTRGGGAVARDTMFRIASMTKPVTAAAAMILVEEGRLRLDDPVDALLPELAARRVLKRPDGALDDTVPARRPITLRDLLTFRLGFGHLMAPPESHPILKAADEARIGLGPPHPQHMLAPDEWLRRLGTLPLMYQPGERWLYDTGANVLGILIARAAGQPFEMFLRERLFAPLGMKDTAFFAPPEKIDRFTTAYGNFGTGALDVYDAAAGGQWSRMPPFAMGGAGLVSTVDDYLAFAAMLLNHGRHGGTRILSRPAVELMTSDQLTPAQKAASIFVPGFFDNQGWGFCMAVQTRRDDLGAPGRYGWSGGLGSSWCNDPREELIGVLLTNAAFTSPVPPPVVQDFWTLAYAAIDD